MSAETDKTIEPSSTPQCSPLPRGEVALSGPGEGRRFPRSAMLRLADQACCAGLVLASLVAMAISFLYQGGLRGRLIDVEKADKHSLHFQLDINQADWPQWSVLPGIGEMLAKRIVQSRETDGPFRSHDDLQRVRGIGPKTLANIREYLLPLEGGKPLPPGEVGGNLPVRENSVDNS